MLQKFHIENHAVRRGTVSVVRDDLIAGGSKSRFLPALLGDAREVVYGGPFCGGAAWALAEVGKRLGIKVSLFYAKRSELHRRQILALEAGAEIYQVPFGYMTNVQAKAKAYAAGAGALFLPLGFDLPAAAAAYQREMKRLRSSLPEIPREIWCATGSGMLARNLATAFPESRVYAVAVGLKSRWEKQAFPLNVEIFSSPYRFEQETKATAPFASCGNYDRKAWEICFERANAGALFWNVAS